MTGANEEKIPGQFGFDASRHVLILIHTTYEPVYRFFLSLVSEKFFEVRWPELAVLLLSLTPDKISEKGK